jgi:5'-nucleotidase
MKRRILISNDDGIYGRGLRPLIRALRPLGELLVIVPDGERSAASHSITLHKPFRIQTLPVELSEKDVIRATITNGTPSDCVRFGLLEILKNKRVDLVIGTVPTWEMTLFIRERSPWPGKEP